MSRTRCHPWVGTQHALCVLQSISCGQLSLPPGVIARSCYWLVFWRLRHLNKETDFSDHLASAIVGAVVESWVFFWYLATYFWTFFFAVDVYNSKHGGKWYADESSFCIALCLFLFYSLLGVLSSSFSPSSSPASSFSLLLFFSSFLLTHPLSSACYQSGLTPPHRRLWCSNLVTWTFCIVYVVGSVASLWACPPYQQ